MALTQQQWIDKLKGFVPTWWFEQEQYNVAVFTGMAAILRELELAVENHLSETFIQAADGQVLDAHGDERSIDRLTGEADSTYSPRIRTIINSSNLPAIKQLVDSVLVVGTSTIIEHESDGPFYSKDSFYNRREIYTDIWYDTFSIIFSNQGAGAPGDAIFAAIVAAVDKAKAFGTLYRVNELKT